MQNIYFIYTALTGLGTSGVSSIWCSCATVMSIANFCWTLIMLASPSHLDFTSSRPRIFVHKSIRRINSTENFTTYNITFFKTNVCKYYIVIGHATATAPTAARSSCESEIMCFFYIYLHKSPWVKLLRSVPIQRRNIYKGTYLR